jgi:hypothetical protein
VEEVARLILRVSVGEGGGGGAELTRPAPGGLAASDAGG